MHSMSRFVRALIVGALVLPSAMTATAKGADLAQEIARAQELDFGAFCLTDLPRGVVSVGQGIFTPDGIWLPVTIRIQAGGGARKPKAFFFDASRPPDPRLRSCAAGGGEVVPILRGTLVDGTIVAAFRPPNGRGDSSRWQIEPGGLDVTFGRVDTHLKKLYGATLRPTGGSGGASLAGRQLEVTNPHSQIFYDLSANLQGGVVRVGTTDVQLSGASLEVAAGPSITIDLACRYDPNRPDLGRVSFDVDVTTGATLFVQGQCHRDGVDFPASIWKSAGLEIDSTATHANRVALVGGETGAALAVTGLRLQAGELRYGPRPSLVATTPQPVAVDELAGPVPNSEAALVLADGTWSGLRTTGAAVQLAGGAVRGTAEIALRSLSADAMAGSLRLAAPSVAPLEAVLSRLAADRLVFDFEGKKTDLKVNGELLARAVGAGALAWQEQDRTLTFESTGGSADASGAEFAFALESPAGKMVLSNPTGAGPRLEGVIRQLVLRGVFRTASGESPPRVSVPPGGLRVDLGIAASTGSLLFGSPAQFPAAALAVSTPKGFELSPGQASGDLVVSAAAIVLPSPALSFADETAGFRLDVPISTTGRVVLHMELASAAVALESGQFHAEGIGGAALGGGTVTVSGIKLVSPAVSLAVLDIMVAQGVGLVAGQRLTFQTQVVEHPGTPYWRAEMAAGDSVVLPAFEAVLGTVANAITVEHVTLHDLKVAAVRGEFKTSDGFAVAGSDLQFGAHRLTESTIDHGSVSVGGGSFAVAHRDNGSAIDAHAELVGFNLTLDGPLEQLNGGGALQLRNISVNGKYRLAVGDCSEADRWRITGAVDIDAANLSLTLAQGRTTGGVDISGGKAYVVNDGSPQRCDWDEPKKIADEKWAIFSLPCGLEGFPPHLKMCDVKMIIVPALVISIHWAATLYSLQDSATIASAHLSVNGGDGLQVCLRHLELSPPLIAASYLPTPNTSGVPLVGKLLDDLLRGAAALVESPILNAIGDGVALGSWLQSRLFPSC
jgi:hypothetical protein